MKVLHISKYYSPHIGGVEKHLFFLANELKKKKIEQKVLTEKFSDNLKNLEIINGIQVFRISYSHQKFLGLIYIWKEIVKNIHLIKETDIIHIQDVFIWYLPFRFIFPFKKVYITFQGWEGKYPIPINNILQKRLAEILCLKNICMGKYIQKYYGIKANEISYGGAEIPVNFIAKKKNYIVYIGRLDKDTGLELFLEAIKKIKGYKIDFCGDGALRRDCEKYGKVHGFVDTKPYLRKAQICFASGYLTILEAMANKCLVITAYNNVLKKDYFTDTPLSSGMISVNSSKKILSTLAQIKKGKKKFNYLIENSYNCAKKYTWPNLSKVYLKLWGIS